MRVALQPYSTKPQMYLNTALFLNFQKSHAVKLTARVLKVMHLPQKNLEHHHPQEGTVQSN